MGKVNSDSVGLSLISLLWLIFFARILNGQYVFFLDDLKIIYYPLEVAYSGFQHAGQLPLWSPLFGFGQPLLAWGQLGFFTPLHFILRALWVQPINLLQISTVAYFFLGLTGFYTLLRQQRLSPLPAALGAIVFTFSGFNIGHLNHVNFYVGTMVLPWLLLAIATFIRRPSLPRAATMSLAASAIALSSQPQVTLYMFTIAAIYGSALLLAHLPPAKKTPYLVTSIGLALWGALLSFLISSLAILPLAEFMPQTDRAADLPVEELLEFSYPPSHAITLIAPYFFGDHSDYWGAKGFQELAAFTGIVPLLLAALALTSWRRQTTLRIFGLLLIIIAVTMALGRHSLLYYYLVSNHILTTLNIPGRFVFFFTTGCAILSAVGLQDLLQYQPTSLKRRALALYMPLFLVVAALVPFGLRLKEPEIAARLDYLITKPAPALLLLAAGLLAFYLALYFAPRQKYTVHLALLLCTVAGTTLLVFGYNYSPVTDRDSFNRGLPFIEPLASYAQSQGLPGRLYSRDTLLQDLPSAKVIASDPVSGSYSIFQPVTITQTSNPCFIIPMQAATDSGAIAISLLPSLLDAPVVSATISAREAQSRAEHRVCFSDLPPIPANAYLHFSSKTDTTIRLSLQQTTSPSAYIVRSALLTPETIEASQKSLRVNLTEDLSHLYDREMFLLARHLQVAGNASGARWIGALAIKPYRDFIEHFLANDSDQPITGDGEHVIAANRRIVDMLGITHMIGRLPAGSFDGMAEAGYTTIGELKAGTNTFRLYNNPAAFAKAWLVPSATFMPVSDEARHAMSDASFDPARHVFISGPAPPSAAELAAHPLQPGDEAGAAEITRYQPTRVTIEVASPRNAWLVLSDSTSPQWQTLVDDQPAPYYVANSFMKTAFVPAGQHTVSFIYRSPATILAARALILGLILLTASYLVPLVLRYYRRSPTPHLGTPPQTS